MIPPGAAMPRSRIPSALAATLGIVVTLAHGTAGGAPPYAARVGVAPDAPSAVREAADELAEHLGRISGAAFTVTEGLAEPGVLLAVAADPAAPEAAREMLRGRGADAVVLDGTDAQRAWIVGQSPAAVGHGVFTWLEQLGCRWFFPNDRWTIVPEGGEVRLEGRQLAEPMFLDRSFFGTGGFGGRLWMDPDGTLAARWKRWQRRNRFGGRLRGVGHGEGVILRNRRELEEHPEYRAFVGGERMSWSKSLKLCDSSPGALELLIRDRRAQLERQIAQAPDDPVSWWIGVEPTDGGWHCECPACLARGTVSDRVFGTANAVARTLAREIPGAGVGLYAYHHHLAPPAAELEPNVTVVVVPYAFNMTGLSAEELLRGWAAKAPSFTAEDKWSLTDWARDLPSFDFLTRPFERLPFWASLGSRGFMLESSYSAGAVGIPLWMVGRRCWDPDAAGEPLLDEFCGMCFGAAAPPMRRMLERWSRRFTLGGHELALSFRDLDEALGLAAPAATARIHDYVRYVQHLRLWLEYETAADASVRHAAARAYLAWAWRIRDSAMVSTYRLHRLMLNRWESADTALAEEWNLADPEAAGWRLVGPVGEDDLREIVRAGSAAYTPLRVAERTFSADLVPLEPAPAGGETSWGPVHALRGLHRFEFVAPPDAAVLPLKFQAGRGRAETVHRLTVETLAGVPVTTLTIPADMQHRDVELPLPGGGHYRLEIGPPSFRLQAPAGWPFVAVGRALPRLASPGLGVFVPAGTTNFGVHYQGSGPLVVRGPDGEVRQPEAGDRTVSFAVPAGLDGAVWRLEGMAGVTSLRLIGLPAVFSLAPGGMMAPLEVTHTTRADEPPPSSARKKSPESAQGGGTTPSAAR